MMGAGRTGWFSQRGGRSHVAAAWAAAVQGPGCQDLGTRKALC